MVFLRNFFKNNFKNKTDFSLFVGQKLHSKKNRSVCSIIKEIDLNNIKQFEICIENDIYKREVILSEYALKLDYKK